MESNVLYPLPFFPIYKDKIWGGDKVKTILNKDFSPLKNCGEMWLLSGCENDVSLVSDGPLAENDLNELLEIFFDDLIGDKRFDDKNVKFPLLVKVIDSQSWLSIQVHPDDAMAKSLGYDNGKSEMWYILDAEPGAKIIAGFNKVVTRQEYEKHVEENTLEEILNYIPVEKGDTIYIPAGLVHALGPGLLVAEIQQPSDITYRISDWNRVDAEGKPRELHLELATQAIDFSEDGCPRIIKNREYQQNTRIELVNCEYFNTNVIVVTDKLDFTFDTEDTFIAFMAVEGSGSITSNSITTNIKRGEVVLLPAMLEDYSISADEPLKLIEMYV